MNRPRSTNRHRIRQDAADNNAGARPRLQLVGLAIAVMVLVAAIHWPVLDAQAQCWDDSQYLTENDLVRQPGWESTKRFLFEVLEPSTVHGYYQPLAMISLMLDCAMGAHEGDFRIFHRTSLTLHVLNVLLVFLLIHALFGHAWVAAATALLFGAHPLTVEPVAWVSDRKTLLATLFALLSLLAYVRYTRSRSWAVFAAAMLCYVLSLLSKPTTLPLPVVMLLLDWWPLKRMGRRAWVEKVPLLVVTALFAWISSVSQQQTDDLSLAAKASPHVLPLKVAYLLAFYLSKILAPINLTSTYVLPEPLALSNGVVLGAVLLIAGLVVLLVVLRRRAPALWVGAAVFAVMLSPMLGFVGFSWLPSSDKYVYLPAVGLLLIAAWGLKEFVLRSSRPGARLVAIVLVLGLVAAEAVGTRRTLAHWRDSETRFRYMDALAPNQSRVLLSLGVVLANEGRIDEGIHYITRSLELKSDEAYGHNHLAVLLAKRGEFEAAIPHLRDAIRYYAKDARMRTHRTTARVNLGNMLLQIGRKDEAMAVFREAVDEEPDNLTARTMIGAGLGDAGFLDEGIEYLQEVLRIDPHNVQARRTLEAAMAVRAQTRPAAP